MLLELVGRRMVADISRYLDRYGVSRLEPPSFLVTPDELQSYIHLPAGEVAESLRSLRSGTSTRGFIQGNVEEKETSPDDGDDAISSKLLRLRAVPRMEKALEDRSVQPLNHLAAATVRTLELVYSGGKTDLLLSAETVDDMRRYAGLLAIVYGGIKFENAEPKPAFLRELPAVVGLGAA